MAKIMTSTGRWVDPLSLTSEDVCLEDIAHALSMICRFGGHSHFFYSVAEHSVLVSESLSAGYALAGLLHDAAEAYLGDIPRPLKSQLPAFSEAEIRAEQAIASSFGLPGLMNEAVRLADDEALRREIKALMGDCLPDPLIRGLSPGKAKQAFLERYALLSNMN